VIGLEAARRGVSRLTQLLMRAIAGLAVVVFFFFGTLSILDYRDSQSRDLLRAEHAKSIRAALERYHATYGMYPSQFLDNPLGDLKGPLVDGGYLSTIPADPLWGGTEKQYRYVSGGPTYGLLLHLEIASGMIPAGGACLTGVETAGTRWWGQPPDCPF
jgi:hypothetical protein